MKIFTTAPVSSSLYKDGPRQVSGLARTEYPLSIAFTTFISRATFPEGLIETIPAAGNAIYIGNTEVAKHSGFFDVLEIPTERELTKNEYR